VHKKQKNWTKFTLYESLRNGRIIGWSLMIVAWA